MRIGILTLPLHTNYGGILQAYALQTVLERMGHEVVVLDTKNEMHLPWWRSFMSFVKRLGMRTVGKNVYLSWRKECMARDKVKGKYVNVFIHRYVKRKKYEKYTDIIPNDFDAIVVGSDQVWRRKYLPGKNVEIPFLSFTEGWNIKRVAYAASFGTDIWEYSEEDTRIAQQAIRNFDAVSTRERGGVTLCKEHLGYSKAVQVLDPTLLLGRKDYESIIDECGVTRKIEGSLMLYVLDYTDEKRKYIEECSTILNMQSFDTNSKYEVKGASLDDIVQPPVEQWLKSFRDSSFVITDSFHACVFSIIFHKPFIVIGNERRGLARFQSLLSMFGLEDRLVAEDGNIELCRKPIDWDKTDELLNKYRHASVSFLRNSLS